MAVHMRNNSKVVMAVSMHNHNKAAMACAKTAR